MDDIEFIWFDNQGNRKKHKYDPDSTTYTVNQYQPWYVSVVSGTEIVPKIMVNGSLMNLTKVRDRDYFKLPDSLQPGQQNIWNIVSHAGLLRLYADKDHPLSPPLYVKPSLKNRDFAAILDRLGQLAIADKNGLLCPVTLLDASPDENQQTSEPFHYTTRVERFLRLLRTFDENFPFIQKSPAREIQLAPKVIDTSKPADLRSRQAIEQACERPGQRRQEIQAPQENYNTAENIFLAYVIQQVILREAHWMADYLHGTEKWLREAVNQPKGENADSYVELWRERQVRIIDEADRLKKIAVEIEERANKAKGYLRAPFLSGIKSAHKPDQKSIEKIDQSKLYGPIYRCYQEYQSSPEGRMSSSPFGLLLALEEKKIKPVPELYEMWTFIEIYYMLCVRFGFTAEGPSPLALTTVDSGELVLNQEEPFKLSFSPKNMKGNATTIDIELRYTPKILPTKCEPGKTCYPVNGCKGLNIHCYQATRKYGNWVDGLTPDIVLTVTSKNRKKTFVLDAKYRDYEHQKGPEEKEKKFFDVDNFFEYDLFGTAKMKYLDALGTNASFILHSDDNPKYTTFGSEPFLKKPAREKALEEQFIPAHRVGAVYTSPSNLDNLEKLLRCILMYHAELENICWPCQRELTVENGGLKEHSKSQGKYYQCPECGRFWVVASCKSSDGHRLIQMGANSFHKTIAGKEGDLQYVCPCCKPADNH